MCSDNEEKVLALVGHIRSGGGGNAIPTQTQYELNRFLGLLDISNDPQPS